MSGPFLGEHYCCLSRHPPNSWPRSPFVRFGILPWGGRSTAIKLSTGDVWVLASTPLTEDTKSTIDKLGPVK